MQFTSDLLPADIIGVNVYDQNAAEFRFKRGPIFANVVLADEINRTAPRTQSSLLEAMSERQVSVDDKTYALDPPFLVIATQNPLESHGTYPLPESQLDRFLMRVSVGYPDRAVERAILLERDGADLIASLRAVFGPEEPPRPPAACRHRALRRLARRLRDGHCGGDALDGAALHRRLHAGRAGATAGGARLCARPDVTTSSRTT